MIITAIANILVMLRILILWRGRRGRRGRRGEVAAGFRIASRARRSRPLLLVVVRIVNSSISFYVYVYIYIYIYTHTYIHT